MTLRIGTSGYSYKEWKGTFYPEDLAAAKMLSWYAERLGTVEINNTFYRMPTTKLLSTWASQVPDSFRFVLKVSQKITHFKRLKGVEEDTEYLVQTAGTLGPKLGALLVQIPPNFARDDERLAGFLGLLPPGMLVALEVRHPSWREPDVFSVLEKHRVALVISQTDEDPEPALVRTAPWGYLRLRRADYTEADLWQWLEKILAQKWQKAFVFIKHEGAAKGPEMARGFRELCDSRSAGRPPI